MTNAAAPAPFAQARFDHVGLTVPDIDAAVVWYGDALGLIPEFEFTLSQFDFKAVVLVSPTGYRVELIERGGSHPGPRPANPIEAAAVQGYGHMCLDVAEVDAAYDGLMAAGAEERMSPRPSPEAGVRMAYVADPNGNLIELIDRAAARARPASEFLVEAHVPVGP